MFFLFSEDGFLGWWESDAEEYELPASCQSEKSRESTAIVLADLVDKTLTGGFV